VLYQLPELLGAKPDALVFVVEGEKDADALTKLGLLATTSASGCGGTGQWREPGFVVPLAGRHVVTLPDNDDPGRKHAANVAQALDGVAGSLKVVELPGLPAKGDVSDWIDQGGTTAALLALVEKAPHFDDSRSELGPSTAPGAQPGDAGRGPRLLTLATVQPRDVDWLWPGRLPAGMVAVLDGEPGTGKSTVVIDLIARLTTGREFPNEAASSPRQPAGGWCAPDCPRCRSGWRPRLDAAGADVNLVHVLTDIGGRPPRLPEDGEVIERVVMEKGARLVVLDPVSAYIGKADFHKDSEVRAALAPLATIAERTKATVLMLRHLRKSGGTNALGRGLGSIAVTALSRVGLMLLEDPEDPTTRVLTWPKMSIAKAPQSLRWRFGGNGDGPPRIEWLGVSDVTADALLAAKDRRDRGGGRTGDGTTGAVDMAEGWLERKLEKRGEASAAEIMRAAKADGIAEKTLRRAKKQLGVRSQRESVGQAGEGRFVWVAPGYAGRKMAKGDRLATLPADDDTEPSNAAGGADLDGARKMANLQDGQPGLAALRNGPQDDEGADILTAAEVAS
jgi:hypothetical protein